jgi:hypothetical protein
MGDDNLRYIDLWGRVYLRRTRTLGNVFLVQRLRIDINDLMKPEAGKFWSIVKHVEVHRRSSTGNELRGFSQLLPLQTTVVKL